MKSLLLKYHTFFTHNDKLWFNTLPYYITRLVIKILNVLIENHVRELKDDLGHYYLDKADKDQYQLVLIATLGQL